MGRLFIVLFIISAAFFSEQFKDDFLNSYRNYVVKLTNIEGTNGGTGFYVKAPSGKIYTLTNGHVCRLAVNGKLSLISDYGKSTVEVISQYEDNDLCVVSVPDGIKSGFRVAFGLRNTENIYVLGHPLLQPKTLTKGQVSGSMIVDILQGYDMPCKGKTFHEEDPQDLFAMLGGAHKACVRTTAANIVTANILPGNSGSPMLNAYGHVVGVAFAGSPGSGRGLIVPLEDVKAFLKDK